MGIDKALIITARHAAVEPRLLQMAARPIDTVLGYPGDGAVGGTAPRLGRPDLDDAANAGVRDAGRVDAGNMVGTPVDAIDGESQVLAQFVG